MISGLGFTEILIVGLIIIMFFGSEDLPKLLRLVGEYWGKIRSFTNAAKAEIDAAVKDVTPNLKDVMNNTTVEEKSKIRKEVKLNLNTMSDEDKSIESAKIISKLVKTDEWQNAKSVLLFVSLKDEPNTTELLDKALKDNKRVIVPYCKDDKGTMGISEIRDIEKDLIPGKFNILEPKEELRDNFFISDLRLIVCPGVAFGIDGSRLGRGKAYYDRFLKQLDGNTPIIGICYSKQLYESPMPFDYHDVYMDKVISSEKVIEK